MSIPRRKVSETFTLFQCAVDLYPGAGSRRLYIAPGGPLADVTVEVWQNVVGTWRVTSKLTLQALVDDGANPFCALNQISAQHTIASTTPEPDQLGESWAIRTAADLLMATVAWDEAWGSNLNADMWIKARVVWTPAVPMSCPQWQAVLANCRAWAEAPASALMDPGGSGPITL